MSQRLSIRTKLAYGLGGVGEGLFQRGYEYFILLYFVSVLGMPATLGGVAMMIATLFDAFTDPLVGSISDNWKSRLGRRHPFMYASALPFAASWFLLLSPPDGLSSYGLFVWFLVFSILLRQALTLYNVPHLALGAELTNDYTERTSVATWSIGLSFVGSFGLVGLFTWVLFPETPEYPKNGMLNPAGYPTLALLGSLVMFISIAYAAWGTRDRVPFLPSVPAVVQRVSLSQMFQSIRMAWRNPSFRALALGTFCFVISISIREVFQPFVSIYFWELRSGQIALLLFPTALGFGLAVATASPLHSRFDKKPTVIVTSIIPTFASALLVILQLVGALPESRTFVLFALATVQLIAGLSGGIAYISARSMMADVAQEISHTSGRSITGVLFSGISFTQKVSSSVGHFVAGVALDLIRLPAGAEPGSVAPQIIQWLGLASLTGVVFSTLGIISYFGYRIDRRRHLELSMTAPGDATAPAPAPATTDVPVARAVRATPVEG